MKGGKRSKERIKPDSDNTLNRVPIYPSVFLCKNNFDFFNWQNIRHLRTRDCDNEIKWETLSAFEDRITTAEFVGLTSYTNIKTLLHRCSNLKSLTLTNILLNHYETDYKRFYIIEANDVTDLKFAGSNKLSKDEMHIFDFFFRRVRFPALKAVTFDYIEPNPKHGNDKRKSKLTLRNNFTKTSVNAASVINFLVQNRTTLKRLQVRRTGIHLCNKKCDLANEPEPEHLKLSLSTFECDSGTIGFENILNVQNQLESLTCASKKVTSSSTLEAVANAIRRCADSLKEIRIAQIVHPGREHSYIETTVQHDCAMYKFCNQLEYLNVRTSVSQELFTTDSNSPNKRAGAILNLRFIPLSISHLILHFDSITQHGIELFINRIPQMSSLKFLVFRGNPSIPFKVKSSWIATLVDSPSLEIFEFVNCKIDDANDIAAFLDSRPELTNSLRVTSASCFLWRESSTTALEKKIRTKSNIVNNNS